MTEIDLIIDVRGGEDSELMDFLNQHGIRARPHYGIYNGPMPDTSEMMKHPAPYLIAGGTVAVFRAAIQAYASTKKKRIIIQRLAKGGLKIDATNYSVEELNRLELGWIDYVSLESTKKKADDDSTFDHDT
jgi:hypothetical protein